MSNNINGDTNSAPTGEGLSAPTAPASSVQDANLNTTQAPASNIQDANLKVTTPTPQDVEDYKAKYESIKPKVEVLERERNDYSKKAKQNEDTLNALDNVYRNDPSAYEVFRQAYRKQTGTDLGDHSKAYGTPTVSSNNLQPNTNGQQINQTQGINVEQIAQQVREFDKKEAEQKAMAQDVDIFSNEHPEYKVEGIDDPEEVKKRSNGIAHIAQLAVVNKAFTPNLTWKEALEQARLSLPEARQELIQKAQLTGEKIGKATAYNSGSAAGKAPSGDNSTIGGSDRSLYEKLNADQKKRYDDHVKRGNTAFAEKYARRVVDN